MPARKLGPPILIITTTTKLGTPLGFICTTRS